MKQRLKRWLFSLLGKEPEAVVVSFVSGDPLLARRMVEEIRTLVPERRHFTVALAGATPPIDDGVILVAPGSPWSMRRELRRALRRYRIGLAPVLFTAEAHPLRAAAFLLAPGSILAYNTRLERHHLRLRTWVASLLFWRGVPLDRIFLRPWWLWPSVLRSKGDRSRYPTAVRVLQGRPLAAERPRVAVLSPYFPYPLSHGGAVRIFHLLREAAREFDIFLFAFTTGEAEADCAPVLEFCAATVLVEKPRYREPRWSTLLPPEVHEFRSPAMRNALQRVRRENSIALLQVEYTHLAPYGRDVLVEHDITFDLYRQMRDRERNWSARWNHWRWRRFEERMLRRYRCAVVMSDKDAGLASAARQVRVIENGVDLDHFQPEPERAGARLLFIGSFRHFPNVAAYRFFASEIWPLVLARLPQANLTVVAGPDHLLFWREFTGKPSIEPPAGVDLHGFVRDVRPMYVASNLVIVPTPVSAGTNVKVLEAMAMERAVVSTSCGCAGLGLVHGESVWIADTAEDFAEGVIWLIGDAAERTRIARAARWLACERFDWKALGEKQRALWLEMLTSVPS